MGYYRANRKDEGMTLELLNHLTADERAAWERAQKATEGPWQYDEICPLSDGMYTWGEVNTADDTHTVAEVDDSPVCRVAPGLNVKHCPQYVADGYFIAHARLDLPAALLALAQTKQALAHMAKIAVERHNQIADLETELAQLRAAVDAAPHEEDCDYIDAFGRRDERGRRIHMPCDCWKSRFLK